MVTIETIRLGPVKPCCERNNEQRRVQRDFPGQRCCPRSSADRLHLEHFVPYRLSVLTNIVSMSIAEAYEREFGLSIPQWRVIAVLARYPDLSAIEVAERTAMDKVAVSRAVQGLLAARRLVRAYDSGDRRRSRLRLSGAGQSVYRRLRPSRSATKRGCSPRSAPRTAGHWPACWIGWGSAPRRWLRSYNSRPL